METVNHRRQGLHSWIQACIAIVHKDIWEYSAKHHMFLAVILRASMEERVWLEWSMTKPFITVIVRPVTQVMHLMPESIVNIRRHRIAPNNPRRAAVAATVICFV